MTEKEPNENNPEHDLEQWVDRELRRLPDYQAPTELINGVLRELARRESIPWWRQPLWQWPRLARGLALATFAVLSLAFMVAGTRLWSGWDMPGWWNAPGLLAALQGWLDDSFLARGNPTWPGEMQIAPAWLFGFSFFCGLVYLLVVGIGSAFLLVSGSIQRVPSRENL